MNFSIGSRHYHVSLLVLLAVALGLLWVSMRSGDAPETDPSRAWMATKDKFHASVQVLWSEVALHLHHEARLNQDTAQLRRTAHMEQGQIENLVQRLDSAQRAPLAASVRRFGEACGELAQNCEQRVLSANDAFAAEHTLRVTEGARIALADSILATRSKATDCRFLLFKCPSRTKVAEVFFVLGAGAVLMVRR